MTCIYCGAWNPDGEHRCQRCGRRVTGTLSDVSTAGNRAIAVAPAAAKPGVKPPLTHPHAGQAGETAYPTEAPKPVQRPLFVDRTAPKVIPFKPAPVPRPAPRPVTKPTANRRPPAPTGTQRKLDFLSPAPPASRKLKTTVEAVIYCDAPVATKAHRALAAALDLSMMVIAFGAFLACFHLAGGEFTLSNLSTGIFAGAFALIALFYGLLWVLANSESPGKHWTRLQLINFDGFPPDRMQRVLRSGGFCLGLCAAATGILWVLVDEESLAWHDHISKTFLTVRERDTNFFRQR